MKSASEVQTGTETGPSLTALMEASGLVPRLRCSLGFLHVAADPDLLKGATYLGVDGGYFGKRTLQGGLAVPQSNRCLTTLLCQQSAAPVFVRGPALRVSVSSSHSAASV